MNTAENIISILLLGFIAGSIPGPMITAVFTEIIHSGFLKSLRVVLWAFLAEVLIALSILIFFFSFDIPPYFFHAISVIGAGILIYMGLGVWKISSLANGEKEFFTLKKIFAIMIFNGTLWSFWITVCIPQAFALSRIISNGQYFFLLFFESGWITANILWAFIFSRFRSILLKKGMVTSVFKIFALLLFYFATKMLYGAAAYLIQYL